MALIPLPPHGARRALVLLLVVALGGCAGKAQTTRTESGFDAAVLGRDGLGLGGVVLAARLTADPGALPPQDVPLDDFLAQSDAWAPVLYEQLLVRAGEATLWPWPAVRDACGDSAMVAALAATARANPLAPEQLSPLAEALSYVRFLAFARIDADELSVEQLGPEAAGNPQVRASRDPHAGRRDAIVKTRRRVSVSMDVHDLQTGGIVWSATVRRQRDELYDFNAADAERTPGVVPEGEPVITATGRRVPAPEFGRVFADACAALAERLLQDSGP